MLFLSRRIGEKIIINSDITFSVESINDKSIIIGVTCPEQYKIVVSKVGEKSIYYINDIIKVIILGLNDYPNRGGQVKFGISAPKNIAVDREEIKKSKDYGKLQSIHLMPLAQIPAKSFCEEVNL